MRRVNWSALAASAVVLVSCIAPDDAPEDLELEDSASALTTCPVSGTVIDRSMVVTDPIVLARFGFARTMTALRASAGVANATQSNASLFRSWMGTFAAGGAGHCDDPSIDPEGYGLACPRDSEAKLADVNPFASTSGVSFVPVGLFNRFDLAPADGAHCGEYRIVYAMQSTNPNVFGRGFLIFEGTLPNPTPAAGIDACLPIARFWQGLSTTNNPSVRADKLEKLYYLGTAIPGYRAVVDARAYGLATGSGGHGAGQIRTNFFIDFLEWQLREFKLRKLCPTSSTCKLVFDHVTAKTNPAEELFAGNHQRAGAFSNAFIAEVPRLAVTNVNKIAMTIQPVFDEFESVSQRFDVDYQLFATPELRARIDTKLAEIGSSLDATSILQRATTQTCAGCHQVSSGLPIGGGKTWPASLGFVHIDEASTLSPALTGTFLPRRKHVLEQFINQRCSAAAAPAIAPDPDATIGGSRVGAAN